MSRLTQILRGKKIKPLTEMESAVKYAIDNAGSGGGSSLPAVTSADNGDLLGVTDGAWAKVAAPTEIIYVPFTVTENQGAFTATTDANYLDAKTAALAGKSVVARCTGLANSIVDVPLEAVATNGTSIHFSRVIYFDTAVVFFWASWTTLGVSVTVKQITAT